MKPSLLLPILLILLPSCRVGCVIEDTMTGLVSAAIVTGLQCTNDTAVKQSVRAAVDKLNMCPEANQKKLVLGPICAILATTLTSNLVNATIPDSWGCRPDTATGTLTTIVTSACMLIPI